MEDQSAAALIYFLQGVVQVHPQYEVASLPPSGVHLCWTTEKRETDLGRVLSQ